ncbi:MAG: hypothetical protein ACE5QF_02915 [Thermoplasmata archaeon]
MTARDGNMCKYLYRGDRCCSPAIETTECVGLEKCDSFSDSKKREHGECTFEAWYGLYCPKYKRFFCPGKGKCETFEQYMESFTVLRREAGS